MAQRRAARGLGADIVGTSVEVFWSGDATWYRGVVSEPVTALYTTFGSRCALPQAVHPW